jgi:hypothetical protein
MSKGIYARSAEMKKDKESRRGRFVRLANKRVNAAIKAIRLVANLSNRANYDYTTADASTVAKALDKELRDLRRRFGALEGSEGGEFHLEL